MATSRRCSRRTGEIKQPKRRQALEENAELARISKQLVTLSREVPVTLPLDALVREPIEPGKLFPFLKAMEFIKAIAKRLGRLLEADPDDWEADPELRRPSRRADRLQQRGQGRRRAQARLAAEGRAENARGAVRGRAAREDQGAADRRRRPTRPSRDARGAASAGSREIYAQGYVAVDTETTGLDNQTADLVGVSLALAPGKAAYLPLGHTTGNGMFGDKVDGQIDLREALALLKPMLEDRSILKIGHNIKYDLGLLLRYGIALAPIDDTLLMSYVLDGVQYNTLSELSAHWLGHTGTEITELIGKGKSAEDLRRSADRRRGALCRRGRRPHHPALDDPQAAPAGREHDARSTRPRSGALAPVLARMEGRGIAVDRNILTRLTGDFTQRAAALEARGLRARRRAASTSARPSSWAKSCSARWGCRAAPRPRPAQWSTGADVLEDLAEREGVPLATYHRRLAPAHQAHRHLHRRAARLHGRAHRARPHHLQPAFGADRAAQLERSEPAEHPGAHRGRPQDQNGVRRARPARS